MKKLFISTIVFLLTGQQLIFSQKPSVKLRQSFESADTKSEPAAITYTKPTDTAASYLIDAAMGISFPANSRKTITIFGEYHRNTLVDEVSNTLQFGSGYELFTNKRFLTGTDRQINGSTSIITSTAKYSNNKIKKIESFQLAAEFTRLYAKGIIPGFLPNSWNQLGSQFAVEYFPSIGFEFEGRYKTKDKVDKGNILRAMGKLNLSIFPLSGWLKNSFEIFTNLNYRHDLINSTDLNDKTHPSLETGANFILFRKDSKKISLGGSYNNMDDPALGKEKQKFWLVALKAKL